MLDKKLIQRLRVEAGERFRFKDYDPGWAQSPELKELGKVSDLLTVQDVTQIKTRELSPAALQEVRDVIARHGAELLAVDHPTTTLEELFLRIVRESDLHPGRRRVAEQPARPATAPVSDEMAGTQAKP